MSHICDNRAAKTSPPTVPPGAATPPRSEAILSGGRISRSEAGRALWTNDAPHCGRSFNPPRRMLIATLARPRRIPSRLSTPMYKSSLGKSVDLSKGVFLQGAVIHRLSDFFATEYVAFHSSHLPVCVLEWGGDGHRMKYERAPKPALRLDSGRNRRSCPGQENTTVVRFPGA